MEKNKVKQVIDNLNKYTHNDKESYITITEWLNEEGIDVTIDDRMFSLHYGELEAIEYLTKVLYYEFNKEQDNK